MKRFKLILGRTIVLHADEGTYAKPLDYTLDRYKHIAYGDLDANDDLLRIGFEAVHAEMLVESLKDDHLFTEAEVHIEVWKYQDGKLFEFEGTLHDALRVAAKEGEQYDV